MTTVRTILLLASLCMLGACSKEEAGCFTPYGDTTTEIRDLQAFDAVYLEGRIDVEYRYDTAYRVAVTYGDGLLDQVRTEQNGGVLRVSNETPCPGLRDPGRTPRLTLYAPSLSYMENQLAGDLTFLDTLRAPVFKYEQWASNGEISLLLVTDTAHVYAHVGYTRIDVVGRTHEAHLYTGSSGPVNAAGLIADVVMANNSSVQDLTVYAGEYLYAFIGRRGSIFYAGEPVLIDSEIEGTGRVGPM